MESRKRKLEKMESEDTADTGDKVKMEKKSLLKQVDDLPEARQLALQFSFVKLPGYTLKPGVRPKPGEFTAYLLLDGEGVNQKFVGEAVLPYEAKRETA